MGCTSKGCVRQREQYRRKAFVRTQLSRVARLEEGKAILIAPPEVRRPLQRAVLTDAETLAVVQNIKLMLGRL